VLKVACAVATTATAESSLQPLRQVASRLLGRIEDLTGGGGGGGSGGGGGEEADGAARPWPRWASSGTLQLVLRVALNALTGLARAVGGESARLLWADWLRPLWSALVRAAKDDATCVEALGKLVLACAAGGGGIHAAMLAAGPVQAGPAPLLAPPTPLLELAAAAEEETAVMLSSFEAGVAQLVMATARTAGPAATYAGLGPPIGRASSPDVAARAAASPPSQPQLLLLELLCCQRSEQPAADAEPEGPNAPQSDHTPLTGPADRVWLQRLVCTYLADSADDPAEAADSAQSGAAAECGGVVLAKLQAVQLCLFLLRDEASESAAVIPAAGDDGDSEFGALLQYLSQLASVPSRLEFPVAPSPPVVRVQDGAAAAPPGFRRLAPWAFERPGVRAAASALRALRAGTVLPCGAAAGSNSEADTEDADAADATADAAASAVVGLRSLGTQTALVTTGHSRGAPFGAARELVEGLGAAGVGARFVAREGASLAKLLEGSPEVSCVLVVGEQGTSLRMRSGANLRIDGGLGVLRMRTVLGGGEDKMVAACGLRDGDVVIDATAGLLCDAIVAAAAVGPLGRVVALEASPLLWAVSSGRPTATGDYGVDKMLRRIEVRLGEHTLLLSQMSSRSADVVYFDPMFRRAAPASAGFDGVLRALACASPLAVAAVVEAKRVARRAVVVMDQAGGAELERLGLEVAGGKLTKRGKNYGVWRAGGGAMKRADAAAIRIS
jgi:hypothetical protein